VIFSHYFGSKLPLSSIKFNILKSETELLIANEKKLFLFNLNNNEISQKFQTHSKPITFLFTNSKLAITYSEEGFFNVFSISSRKSPILSLKSYGNYCLKNVGFSKIKQRNYMFYAQYTEIIQFWIIELSEKFSQSNIVDSYVIRAPNKEKINNSLFNKNHELVLCLGHHLDLKFIVFAGFIDKNSNKINRNVIMEQVDKMKWVAVEPSKKNTKKTHPQKTQVLYLCKN